MTGTTMTALVAALLLASCGSSLHARRFDDGTNVEGIPYALPEASFVISESPATSDKPTTYSLALALTPSTKDLYWVRVSPSTFTSSDVTLTLGSQGQLTAFNGQGTPALVPVIQAIGDFVVTSLGVAARAVAPLADTSDLATPGVVGELEKLATDPGEACAARPDLKKLKERLKTEPERRSEFDKLLAACIGEVKAAIPQLTARLNRDLDSASNVARLYATNDSQRAALELAAQASRSFRHPRMDSARADYKKIPPAQARNDDLARIDAAITDLSKTEVAAVDPSQASTTGDVKAVQEKFRVVKEIAVRTIDERLLAKQFELAVKLSARDWRNRHATVLEDRLDALDQSLALAPADGALRSRREKLLAEWAVTIDGLREFERAQILRTFLVQPPSKALPPLGAGSQQSRMNEYVLARTELDSVSTALAQKRQALKPTSALVTKPQPRDIRVMPLWHAASLDAEAVASTAKGSGYPEFVVVVERGVKP